MPEKNSEHLCECYKKLALLGIPLYISEENNEYAEGEPQVIYEKAFQCPDNIRINRKIKEYPMVEEMELSEVFIHMAEVVKDTSDFDTNILSFWILDMFIEGLWTAQNHGMEFEHQKTTLLWIAYFFNYIIHQNPKRKELFTHLKEILFFPEGVPPRKTGTYAVIGTEEEFEDAWHQITVKKPVWQLPLPPNTFDANDDEEEVLSKTPSSTSDIAFGNVTPNSPSTPDSMAESNSDKNTRHMIVILEILYRIFARLWVYLEIQSSIHNMPNTQTVELPFKIHVPKPCLKYEDPTVMVKRGKKSSVREKSQEKTPDDRESHKNDYILPLQASEEAKVLAKFLFGPPASEKKGRGNKKKKG